VHLVFWYGKHSRDTTVLIDYCDLMLCTTPACFSTFFQATMVPTLLIFLVDKIKRNRYIAR